MISLNNVKNAYFLQRYISVSMKMMKYIKSTSMIKYLIKKIYKNSDCVISNSQDFSPLCPVWYHTCCLYSLKKI